MFKISTTGSVNVYSNINAKTQRAIKIALPEVAEAFRASMDFNFRKGGRFGKEKYGGGSERWKISARAKEQAGQTLVDTRRLANSITFKIVGTKLQFGSNVKYAAIHQYGGIIRGKTRKGLIFKIGKKSWRRVQSVKIPARPFMVLQRADIELATKIIQRALRKV